MEVFDFMEVSPNCADGLGFTRARMSDEGGVEVGVEVRRGLKPNLLLKNRRDSGNGGPFAPNYRRFNVLMILYELVDPRWTLPVSDAVCRPRLCSP